MNTTEDAPQLSRRQVRLTFGALMLGMLLAALDQTIVATALPTITGELGGLQHLSWVVTAYLLASTVSTPLYGKLGDLFGRKKLFQAAIVTFLVGSALCGLSRSMLELIVFRAVQGVGAGGLIVLALAIIGDLVPPRERGRYQGLFGAVFGAASIAGPLLGGFFTDQLSWRWVFYVNLPVGAAALAVTAAVLPATRRRGNPRIDYLGAALLTAAVTCIVLVTTWGGTTHPWRSAPILGLAATATILLAVLVVVERRVAEPIVPVKLFRTKTFNVASSVSFIIGVAMFGAISFLPLFLQIVTGASATDSGLRLLPLVLGMLVASIVSGHLITRTGRYRAFPIVGCGIATVGMALLSTMGPDTGPATPSIYMLLLGAGMGCSMQTLVLATQNAVPVSELGVATSSVTFFRSLGGSLGTALFGAIFSTALSARLGAALALTGEGSLTPSTLRALPAGERATYVVAFADSLTTVFRWAVPLIGLAFVITWLLEEVPLRRSVQAAEPARDLTVSPATGTASPGAAVIRAEAG